MSRNKLKGSTLAVTMAALIALGACSGGGDSDEVVTLEFWSFIDPTSEDPRGEALAEIVEGFNSSHPTIQVEVTNVHFSELDAQLLRAAATGGGPDVTDVFGPWITPHAEAGSLLPINEYVDTWMAENGDDLIAPMDGFTFDDEIIAMPWEARVILMYYRQDLLDATGVGVPQDLDELAAAAAEISAQEPGIDGFPVPLGEGAYGTGFMEVFVPLLWSFGGDLFGEDGRAVFDSEAGVQAMQWIKDLQLAGGMRDTAVTMDTDGYLQAFQAGTAGIGQMGSHRVSAARGADGIGDNLVTGVIPGVEPGVPAQTIANSWALGIGANSENPDEAWEFIEYRLEAEAQSRFMDAGVMSVLSSAFEQDGVDPELLQWRDYLSEYGRAPRYPADYNELSTNLAIAAQSMVFRDAPIAETLSQLADDYNS